MFPGDDADAAFARFEEVGAETEPERVQARICRAANARDWAALRACFADDYLSVDHRALGWEPQQGADDTVVLYRSWVEIAPDFESHFDVLAGDDQHVAVRLDARGHGADDVGGGELELVIVAVGTVCYGVMACSELYETQDEGAALARLRDLGAGGSPV